MTELKALREMHKAAVALRMTAPVDDDFPLMMHSFDKAIESATHFIGTEADNINELIEDTGSWAEKTLPKSTELSVLKHMQEEFGELIEAIDPEDKAEEAADILLLLCHYCYKNKINLAEAVHSKLELNKTREWEQEPNAKGYFNHIENDK